MLDVIMFSFEELLMLTNNIMLAISGCDTLFSVFDIKYHNWYKLHHLWYSMSRTIFVKGLN